MSEKSHSILVKGCDKRLNIKGFTPNHWMTCEEYYDTIDELAGEKLI